jgi:hypothetical protein
MFIVRRSLTLADREEISRGMAESLDYKDIAARIGRDPSIVSREVTRHGGRNGYRATTAQSAAVAGRARPKSLWLNGGVPATEVAARAGHSVDVLLKVYAKCIYGKRDSVNKKIEGLYGDEAA